MQLQSTLFFSFLCAAFVSTSALPPSRHLVSRQVPSKPCSHLTGGVHLIVAPGAGSANPPFGLLSTTAASILRAIPGSSNVSLPYDHSDTNGIHQSDQGAATLRTYIQQYHQSCPNTRIVLLGYSSGGIIVMNTLCGETNPPFPSNIAPLSISDYSGVLMAAVTYGEETRTASATYNHGSCTNNSPHPRPSAAQANCQKWAQILESYCDSADPACCTGGTDMNAHYGYATEYDQDATNFVVAQFRKFGA